MYNPVVKHRFSKIWNQDAVCGKEQHGEEGKEKISKIMKDSNRKTGNYGEAGIINHYVEKKNKQSGKLATSLGRGLSPLTQASWVTGTGKEKWSRPATLPKKAHGY